MNEQLFLEKFTEQLEGHDGTPIEMTTEFRGLEAWDSLTGVAVQIMIGDDFNAPIPDAEFAAAKTVGELYLLAEQYKA